jgi:hypothetical protein
MVLLAPTESRRAQSLRPGLDSSVVMVLHSLLVGGPAVLQDGGQCSCPLITCVIAIVMSSTTLASKRTATRRDGRPRSPRSAALFLVGFPRMTTATTVVPSCGARNRIARRHRRPAPARRRRSALGDSAKSTSQLRLAPSWDEGLARPRITRSHIFWAVSAGSAVPPGRHHW